MACSILHFSRTQHGAMTHMLSSIPDISIVPKFINKRIYKSSIIAVNEVSSEYHSDSVNHAELTNNRPHPYCDELIVIVMGRCNGWIDSDMHVCINVLHVTFLRVSPAIKIYDTWKRHATETLSTLLMKCQFGCIDFSACFLPHHVVCWIYLL